MLKKSTWLALGFAAVSLPSAFSQTVLFSEDFNNGFPANFTRFNEDGLTPASVTSFVTDAWVCRSNTLLDSTAAPNDSAAISTSWYLPAGTADDWMFTPAITIPTGDASLLTWRGVAWDSDYPDGYEVRISTVAPTSANIDSSALLVTVGAENTSWTMRNAFLTSYAGQTIYIGFRNNSADMNTLSIDDIKVTQLPSKDVYAIRATTALEYTQYPLSQFTAQQTTVNGQIANVGGTVLDTVRVSATVIDLTTFTPLGIVSGTALNLGLGAVTTVTTTSVATPAAIGLYTGILVATTTGDTIGANDTTFIQPWAVTDTVYARDNDDFDAILSLGAARDLGTTYAIMNADTATSISVFFGDSDSTAHVTARIWTTDTTGTPTAILVNSLDTLPMVNGWQTFRLPANTILANGNYLVSVAQLDLAIALGASSNDFVPGVSWYGSTTSGFRKVEDINFPIMPGIRLNLGHSNAPISVNKVADNAALSVMPNPSNGVFNVRLDLQEATDAELVVTSIDGKQIRREQLGMQSTIQRNIDLSELANGVYVLQVRTTKGTYTQRITKQ